MSLLKSDVRACRRLLRRHDPWLALGLKIFSREKREAGAALLAYFRLPEILAHEYAKDVQGLQDELRAFNEISTSAFEKRRGWEYRTVGHQAWVPVLRAAAQVFETYKIPQKYHIKFREICIADAAKPRYATYGELEKALYGFRSIPCRALVYVFGFTDKRVFLHAEELGYALGLTSAMCRLKWDMLVRGKIFLPENELKSFELTPQMFESGEMSETLNRFMGFQLSRARALCLSADEGIPLLKSEGQLAVSLINTWCETMLDKIEREGYNVSKQPPTMSGMEMLIMTYRVYQGWKKSSLSYER